MLSRYLLVLLVSTVILFPMLITEDTKYKNNNQSWPLRNSWSLGGHQTHKQLNIVYCGKFCDWDVYKVFEGYERRIPNTLTQSKSVVREDFLVKILHELDLKGWGDAIQKSRGLNEGISAGLKAFRKETV